MSLPPFPWSYETRRSANTSHQGAGHVYLVDATGKRIASVWGHPDAKLAMVARVLDAVNPMVAQEAAE
jgi:hypothetical protein